ncbi:RICIN domain-containing protein [Streptomyces cadmiisoli]|uniref:RICIN domain-containing protein n=1 Tax=Streptomyces cadmiisoli TaxID=2184053 RepID=UPI003668CF96
MGERSLNVHFHGAAGALVFGWDTDADELPALSGEEQRRRIAEQVPGRLRACLWRGTHAADRWRSGHQPLFPRLSVVMWRLPSDSSWRTPEVAAEHAESDVWTSLVSDLTDPSPGTLMQSERLGVERSSFRLAGAIRHVLAMRPLTDEVVGALNPRAGRDDRKRAVTANGYPRGLSRPGPPLDRGIGEGAALVTGDAHRTWGHFLFEPDGAGYHRIMVHHSGKALQTAGGEPGAALVQAEPRDGDPQKFLLQQYRNGVYQRVHTFTGVDATPGAPDGSVYRIIAKESRLALQVSDPVPGSPVTLAEPDDGDGQLFCRRTLFGYGLFGHLRHRATDVPILIRPPARPYG